MARSRPDWSIGGRRLGIQGFPLATLRLIRPNWIVEASELRLSIVNVGLNW
jgi:hypothetical protein